MVNKTREKILDDGMKTYRGNWQEVKYTRGGAPYVTYKGARLLLDDFLRSEYKHYCGVYSISMFACYLIEIDGRGERARVTYSFC